MGLDGSFRPVHWPHIIRILIALASLPSPGAAQEADAPSSLEPIAVTGSHLLRTDTETAGPLEVISADRIRQSGYTSIAEVLQNITANNMGTLSQAAPQSSAAGAAGIALRGLTVGATLVLIDGHRMAPYPLPDDGTRYFVDIASIPVDAVERIEVLKDGASSVYGSEAIAGVVNVILKRGMSGTTLSAESGITARGDGQSRRMALAHGWGAADANGSSGYIALDLSHQDAISLARRSYLDTADWRPYGGANLTQGTNSGAASGASSGGGSGTGYLTNQRGEPVHYFPGCSAAAADGGGCGYTNPYVTLQPQTQHIDVLASSSFKLDDAWELNVQGSILRSESRQVGLYNNAFTTGVGSGANGGGASLVRFGFGAPPTPAFPGQFPFVLTVPAGYPGNPTGKPAPLVYDFPDLGPQNQDVVSTSYRAVVELHRSSGQWDTNASAGATKVTTRSAFFNYLDFPAVQTALDDGSYQVGADNGPALLSALAPAAVSTSVSELFFAGLRASRSFGHLPGGPVSADIGIEATHQGLDEALPPSFAEGVQNLATYSFARGQQNVVAQYFEVLAPVTQRFDLDLSARADHYESTGTAVTPKLAAKFSPAQAISLRGTYGQGFRAPTPAEIGTAGSNSGYVGGFYDPLKCPGGPTAAGPNLPACDIALKELQLPAAHLAPERSISRSFGVIVAPSPNLSANLDYYRIAIHGQIISTGQLGQISLNDASALGTVLYRDSAGRLLYDTNTFINANTTSTSGVDLDLRAARVLGDTLGRMEADLQWTYLLSYDLTAQGVTYHLAGTHGPSYISEDTGTPRGRARLELMWTRGPLEVSAVAAYISSYGVTDPSAGVNTCAAALASEFPDGRPPARFCTVGSFTEINATIAYAINERWRLNLGVVNLLDRRAPLDLQTFGSAGNGPQQGGAPYNPSLHQDGAVGLMLHFGVAYRI